MSLHEPLKEFSVERRTRQRRRGGRADESEVDQAVVLEAINRLSGEIAALRDSGNTETGTPNGSATGYPLEPPESLDARIEIAQMVRMIGRAKVEIASIKHPLGEDDRMLATTNELDAIVVATETSTEAILEASETIDKIVGQIAGFHDGNGDLVAMTDRVAEEVIKIMEACSFQDITGQRINKAIKTIQFIESRILAMIEIWGAEAFVDLPISQDANDEGDDGLMNGPQLANQGISQDDINALFD